MKFSALPLLGALLLVGCGSPEGQGGLTADEERQLDNAARMLDDNMVDVSPDSLVANEADLEAIESAPEAGVEQNDANVQ